MMADVQASSSAANNPVINPMLNNGRGATPGNDPNAPASGNNINTSSSGFFGPIAPTLNPSSTLDAGNAQQIANIQNGLLTTPQQNAANITAGTEAAGNIANQSTAQGQEQNELGGGGMPGMNQAISERAAKNFATSQGRIQQNAQVQGQMMANQQMNTAVSNAIALQNAQNGVDSAINQYNLQANAARYQTISSIMSGAGALGGAYFGKQNGTTPSTAPYSAYNSQWGQSPTGTAWSGSDSTPSMASEPSAIT